MAKDHGLSIREFEQKAGLNRGNVSNMTGAIGSDKLSKIIDAFPMVNLYWLVTGEGEKSTTPSPERRYVGKPQVSIARDSGGGKPIYKDDQERVAKALQSAEGIPLIPLDAVAGFCSGNSTQVMEYECEKYVVPSFRGAEFLIQVKGSSMFPKYASGDIVACKCLPLGTFFQWNKVYVVDTEQGVLIKRVRRGPDDDHITLVSEDERYEPFVLHKQDIRSLAIVIGVIRLE